MNDVAQIDEWVGSYRRRSGVAMEEFGTTLIVVRIGANRL
jgi:hypothetical protein